MPCLSAGGQLGITSFTTPLQSPRQLGSAPLRSPLPSNLIQLLSQPRWIAISLSSSTIKVLIFTHCSFLSSLLPQLRVLIVVWPLCPGLVSAFSSQRTTATPALVARSLARPLVDHRDCISDGGLRGLEDEQIHFCMNGNLWPDKDPHLGVRSPSRKSLPLTRLYPLPHRPSELRPQAPLLQ